MDERMTPPVDCIGLALDLEQQAERIESQTAQRAMCAAATGLRRIDAHLTQSAQAVDVGAIREVAKELNMDFVASEKQLRRWADKLTRAIGNAQAEKSL